MRHGPRSTVHGSLLLVLVACTTGTDHERLGDRRYAERAWADALAEYRLAGRQSASVELQLKHASAALRAGALEEAAHAFRSLAEADPAGRGEAAEGLVRTIRAALAARDVVGLRSGARALREVAPERLSLLGEALTAALEPPGAGDGDLLLAAAAAGGREVTDSLVALWAELLARASQCDQAVAGFEGVLRRGSTPTVSRGARAGLAGCRVEAGRAALAAGMLEDAVAAFSAAIALGVPDSTVRLAWVLTGDARWANGDSTGAVDAYSRAAAGGPDDNPLVERAREQLRRLSGGNPDQP